MRINQLCTSCAQFGVLGVLISFFTRNSHKHLNKYTQLSLLSRSICNCEFIDSFGVFMNRNEQWNWAQTKTNKAMNKIQKIIISLRMIGNFLICEHKKKSIVTRKETLQFTYESHLIAHTAQIIWLRKQKKYDWIWFWLNEKQCLLNESRVRKNAYSQTIQFTI